MFFKNLRIKQSKWINTLAASCFGVLCIHDNCQTMRDWLWIDTLHMPGWFSSVYYPLYAICMVLIIYMLCTLLDFVRMRWIEKPLFAWINKKYIHQ